MLKHFIGDLIYRIRDDNIQALAAQFSYYFILALFPFLIFFITLVSYTPLTGEQALETLSRVMPSSAYAVIRETIDEITRANRFSALSLGAAATLWAASNGVVAVIRGLNRAYDVHETRSFIRVRIISIGFTLLIVFLLIFSLITLVFGEIIAGYVFRFLRFEKIFARIWNPVRYIISFAAIFIMLAVTYYFLPNRKLCAKELLAGTLFAALGLIAVSTLFSFYVNNFTNYNLMYGSLGGIIALLLWLYYCSLILLLGGEINASCAFYREHGKLRKDCKG